MSEPAITNEALVVSTSPTLRALLELSIEEQDMHPLFFDKTQEGLNHLKIATPKILILDDKIDIDPYAVIGRLKMSRRLRTIPVMLLIEAGDQAARMSAEVAQVSHIVTKPIDRKTVSSILASVSGKMSLRDYLS